MKNRELIGLMQGLQSVGSIQGSVKFAYAIGKNLRKVTSEVQTIMQANKPFDDFLEFDKKRIDLCKEFASLDEKGKPKAENGKFIIDPEKEKIFEEKLEELRKEYKEAIEKREKQEEEYEELLDSESDIELHKVKEEFLPEGITGIQVTQIFPIIMEEEEDKKSKKRNLEVVKEKE